MPTRREGPVGAEILGVYLEPTPSESVRVGSLLSGSGGGVTFVVDDGYIERGPDRPILSLAIHATSGEKDTIGRLRDTQGKISRGGVLPAFFTNLLPEGALRSLVQAQLPAGDHREFGMLRRLGGDLPGAVVVREESMSRRAAFAATPVDPLVQRLDDPAIVKFSLAGVQMKFSMIEAGERLTMPAHGEGGRVIVKFPSRDYPDLPEIEFSAMSLAGAAGIRIADIVLVPASRVEGITTDFLDTGRNVLAVRRFDRYGDRRIHMEDFAQILGAVGDEKYRKANIETTARLVVRFTPDPAAAVLEMVRRIVVDIMLGNGDGHLKNTSFLYADGRTPTLSPAYDIVPTIAFKPNDDLALRFNGKRAFERINAHDFERMAGFIEISPRVILREIERTVEQANDTWPVILRDLPWPQGVRNRLSARWPTLGLFEGKGNPFQ